MHAILRTTLTATAAAVTAITGIGFGPAATATATPVPSVATPDKMQVLFKTPVGYRWATDARVLQGQTVSFDGGSAAAAQRQAPMYRVVPASAGYFTLRGATCLGVGGFGPGSGLVVGVRPTTDCDVESSQWTLRDGGLVNRTYGAMGSLTAAYTATEDGETRQYAAIGRGTAELGASRDAMTATVTAVDADARTATLTGTALAGAELRFTGGRTLTVPTSGTWTTTITGLQPGTNEITITERLGGTWVDQVTVTAELATPGSTITPGTTAPVALTRGGTTDVPFTIENTVARTGLDGTVSLTAPEGTTFRPQTTVEAQHRGADGRWVRASAFDLVDGRSDDGRTHVTFSQRASGTMPVGEFRWTLSVETPAGAGAGPSTMQYVVAGTSSAGAHRAAGSTTTTLAEAPAPAPLEVITPTEGSTVATRHPVFSGTGADGAVIEVRGTTRTVATTTVERGAWSVPSDLELANGVYRLTVTQTPASGAPESRQLTFTVRHDPSVGALTATAAFDAKDENLPATISGNAQIDATVTVTDATGAVIGTKTATGGKYTITIPPAKAKFGINTFTITQTVQGKVSEPLTRTLDYGNPVDPTITSPTKNATVPAGKVQFTGTGATGAKIDIRGLTSAIGTSTVTNGAWTVDTRELTPNFYRLFAVQTSKGGLTKQVETAIDVRR